MTTAEPAEGLAESGADPERAPARDERAHHRAELWREATIMVLYVSVVEIAELAALPEERFANGVVVGPTDGSLLALVWGTAIGLALAHWFAFGVAAPGIRGLRPNRHHAQVGLVQVGGAAFVAAVSSLPVLLLSDDGALEFTGDVPAVIIGVIAYLVARATGQKPIPSVVYAVAACALGVVVALVKYSLAAH